MDEKSNLYIVAIVGIIAVVALVVLVMNVGARQSLITVPSNTATASGDSAGQVVAIMPTVTAISNSDCVRIQLGQSAVCTCWVANNVNPNHGSGSWVNTACSNFAN
jgi:hypothetical protein